MSESVLHPEAARAAFLLGTWRGEGTGAYPTAEPFTYEEEAGITWQPSFARSTPDVASQRAHTPLLRFEGL
ncbi:MAG: heme-binding beta-barrel domain-containing protein [Actinomycetota bacterium]